VLAKGHGASLPLTEVNLAPAPQLAEPLVAILVSILTLSFQEQQVFVFSQKRSCWLCAGRYVSNLCIRCTRDLGWGGGGDGQSMKGADCETEIWAGKGPRVFRQSISWCLRPTFISFTCVPCIVSCFLSINAIYCT
jgi:hypothetical protein